MHAKPRVIAVECTMCSCTCLRACRQAPAPVHSGEMPAKTRTSRHDVSFVGMAGTRSCGGVVQHVPYVKTMFGAVIKLKRACSQAVHNKERCTALAECVHIASHSSLVLHPSTPKA